MRREFPEPVKREIRARSGGVCECYMMPEDILHKFPQPCSRVATDIDHIYAETLQRNPAPPLTAEDGAHLSSHCHKIKTRSDQAMRKVRGKMTPRKNRPKKGWFKHTHGKKIPTRPLKRRAIPGNGWPKKTKAKKKR